MSAVVALKDRLIREYPDRVFFDEPMSRHTSFKVGGPAEIFACPRSIDETVAMATLARSEGLPLLVVGDGTNLIVRDGGIPGMTLSLRALEDDILWEEDNKGRVLVRTHAGVKTRDLCKVAWENGYEGLNFALGIPGTLGGNIAMNAGTRLGSMEDILVSVEILDDAGLRKKLTREDLTFEYRRLIWPDKIERPLILTATLGLCLGDSGVIEEQARSLLKTRTKSQPIALPNAGCIFKNPSGEEPAGKLIDMAGLKGLTIGGARVSEKHANFIVNINQATAADILALILKIQDTVKSRWGVSLETEVNVVGQEA